MNAASPCVGSAMFAGADAHREHAVLTESPVPCEQRLRIEAPMIVAERREEEGATTPEACTDGDNDSSDDERRGLHKASARGAGTRTANGLRGSCRWLSTHKSFCAQPALLSKEQAKYQRRAASIVNPSPENVTDGWAGRDRARAGRVSAPAGVALGKMLSPAPGALVQVGRRGTTQRRNMIMNAQKVRGRALENISGRAPAAMAIQAGAVAAVPSSPASPSKMSAVSCANNAAIKPYDARSVKHARVRGLENNPPLPPPRATSAKKRKIMSSSASLSSALRPKSKVQACLKGTSWLEAEWAAAATAAIKRAGWGQRQSGKALEGAKERPRPRPRAVGASIDLSCSEEVDVDAVMNAGGEMRTPICRFLLPCWPEGVEGYEEVGGWRRLGGPAPEGGAPSGK